MIDRLRLDLHYALVALRRAPTLTASVVVVLALAVGANTAIFSLVRGVLLRPLPWPESERLVRVREYRQGDTRGWRFAGMTNDTYDTWQRSARMIEQLAAYSSRAFTLTGAGEPVRLQATAATPSMFTMLGLVPAAGRVFRPEEALPGANRVVILGHAVWRDRFGSDRSTVGRVITLDGEPYTVVGVAPASFYFPDRETRAWVPLHVPPPDRSNPEERNVFFFAALARLARGATPEQASAEATAAARQEADGSLASGAMLGQGPPSVEVRPLLAAVTDTVRPALLVLFAAVAGVLLIACANLASLLLSRGLARRRELAVRAALGAGRARIAQQLLLESLLLGLGGGAIGIALAVLMIRTLAALGPGDFPRMDDVALDGTVLLFSLVTSIVASLLFGAGPALQGARVNLVAALNEGGAALGGGLRRLGANRARSALLVAEIALAITLLVGAGLLARSFIALVSVDPGYDASNVLTARISFPRASYDPPRVAVTLDRLLARLRAAPTVKAAGTVNLMPLTPGETMVMFSNPFAGDARGPESLIRARLRVVSPGFVEAMGLRVKQGRAFTWDDTRAAVPALMVNEAFVRELLRGREAIGTRLPGALEGARRDWQIVGVVGDVRQASLTADPMPEVWASWTQLDRGLEIAATTASLAVRTTGDPVALAPLLRDTLRAIDSNLALADVMTMERRVSASIAQPRFATLLLGTLAAVALLLVGTGIYGILAFGVAQRRREIGVRSVLGATPADVVRLVVGQGLGLTGAGLLIGLLGALLLAPLMANLLYGVQPADPVTLLAVSLVVVMTAALAAFVPARRATRVDPAETLRAN